MPKAFIGFLMVAISLAGCAHRGAARVECEGPLRPINRPAKFQDAPVSVVPASPNAAIGGERQP